MYSYWFTLRGQFFEILMRELLRCRVSVQHVSKESNARAKDAKGSKHDKTHEV